MIAVLVLLATLQTSNVDGWRLGNRLTSQSWRNSPADSATNLHALLNHASSQRKLQKSNGPVLGTNAQVGRAKMQKSKSKASVSLPDVPTLPKKHQTRKVTRVLPLTGRKSLSEFKVGDKHRGRVISVRDNGLFVDVGSTKDGFVHVKDCSDKYFIDDIGNRYAPGTDLDVYIKFVDPEEKILGLQLYPVVNAKVLKQSAATFDWKDLQVRQALPGVVVKSSEFGVYVDFGGPTMGFLHRRKMLSNRRQRKLKPWEVCPIGSTQVCYIYKMDLDRNRIELSTYPPERWEGNFVSRDDDVFIDENDDFDDEDEDDNEDDEELGGSARAQNIKAVRRILAIKENDEDNDGDSLGGSEDILSPTEIESLTGKRLLIDDIGETASGELASKQADKGDSFDEDDEEMPLDELFAELSGGRAFITFTDIRDWDYMQALVSEKVMSRELLKSFFIRAGAVRGRLPEDRFERFVALVENEMAKENNHEGVFGSDDDDEDEDEDEDRNEDFLLEVDEDYDDDEDDDEDDEEDNDNDGEDDDEEGDEDSMNIKFEDLEEVESQTNRFAKKADRLRKEEVVLHTKNDLVDNIFKSLAQKKTYVTQEDVLGWGFCSSLVNEGISSAQDLRKIYSTIAGGPNRNMNRNQFAVFLNTIKDLEARPSDIENFDEIHDNEGDEEDDDGIEDVSAMFDAEDLERAMNEIDESVWRAGVAQKEKDALVNMAKDDDEDDLDGNLDDEGREDTVDEDAEDEEEDEDEDEENSAEEDRKNLINVFQSLANGKSYIRSKDLLNWDFVLDLLTEGVLTEQTLDDKVKSLSSGRGMDVEGFDTFVNDMIELYKDSGMWNDDDENDEDEDDEGEENYKGSLVEDDYEEEEVDITEGYNALGAENQGVEAEEDDDYMEIDPAEVFAELGKGKSLITFEAVKKWSFVRDMIESQDLSKLQLDNLFSATETKVAGKLDLEEFENLIDEIIILCGGEVEHVADSE